MSRPSRPSLGLPWRWALPAAGLLALSACAEPPVLPHPVAFTDLPGWQTDRVAEAIPAFREGCVALGRMPPDRALGGEGPLARRAGDFAPACAEAASLPPGDEAASRAFLLRHFTPWAVGEDRLTGYYEPSLPGSTTRTTTFPTPLLARPPALVEVDLGAFANDLRGRRTAGMLREGRLVPFHDRAAIAAGALAGQGLELAWVDPIDAFFLHIQGSGRVVFDDGRVLRLGYAAQNGHAYVAVGRALVDNGTLAREAVSMQAIRDWMRQAGPEAAAALMYRNPSYVFFRPLDLAPEKGPLGSLGVPLTPGRSVAVDRAALPLGSPIWVAGRLPAGEPLERLTMAQDTGGAIRGAARADLFTGWTAEAAEQAGRMRDLARVFVLLPR